MGRTVLTYRNLLDEEISAWGAFKRALRREDREVFDGLLSRCREHASASSYAVHADPFEPMIISILIEMEKENQKVQSELERLKKLLVRDGE